MTWISIAEKKRSEHDIKYSLNEDEKGVIKTFFLS